MSFDKDFQKYLISDDNQDNIEATSIRTNQIVLYDNVTESTITLSSANDRFAYTTNLDFSPIFCKYIMAAECVVSGGGDLYINSNDAIVCRLPNSPDSQVYCSFITPTYVPNATIIDGGVLYRCNNPLAGSTFSIGVYIYVYSPLTGLLINTYSNADFPLPAVNSGFQLFSLQTLFPQVDPNSYVNFKVERNSSSANDTNAGDMYIGAFEVFFPKNCFV